MDFKRPARQQGTRSVNVDKPDAHQSSEVSTNRYFERRRV